MEIDNLREEIDIIDSQLVKLFVKRMEVVEKIGEAKSKTGAAVEDAQRESKVLFNITQNIPEDMSFYITELYMKIFALTKLRQRSKDLEYALVGENVKNSFSPNLHSFLGKYSYKLLSMNASDFDLFMKLKPFDGINVTMPYKERALSFCDVLSKEAEEIGCVNTIKRKDNKLYGFNTDINGIKFMLDRGGISLKDKNVLILGTGGTSKTAEYAARNLGAKSVRKVSRNKSLNYENVYDLNDIHIIINTTPVGMAPNNEGEPIDVLRFKDLEAYADAVYTPLKTSAVVAAEERGIKSAIGIDMLCAQAFYASEIFSGEKLDSSLLDKLCYKIKYELTNIVLMGMPGCGKSKIAKILSQKTGRRLIDTDKIIEQKTAKECGDIICEFGEDYFRTLESEVIKEVAKENGCIIALGGGSISRKENQRVLKENSALVYVERECYKLATKGRPLSRNKADLNKLFKQRDPIYRLLADFTVDNNSHIEKAANDILVKFDMYNKNRGKK